MIGVGPMAALHAQVLSHMPGVRLAWCASREQAKAQAFADRFHISRARVIDEIDASPQADALWIVAPCHVMAGLAERFGGLGLPMFLEKPVGLSLTETTRTAQAVTSPNMVGVNRRFYEVIIQARRLMREAGGVRGVEVHMPEDLTRPTPTHADITRQQWQFANSIHLIDLFRFFGGEVSRVINNNLVLGEADRAYSALLNFENGGCGIYNAQWYAPGGWRVAAYGNDITIVLQPLERAMIQRRGQPVENIDASGADTRFKPGLWGQAEAFIALANGKALPEGAADLNDYLRSVALAQSLTDC